MQNVNDTISIMAGGIFGAIAIKAILDGFTFAPGTQIIANLFPFLIIGLCAFIVISDYNK